MINLNKGGSIDHQNALTNYEKASAMGVPNALEAFQHLALSLSDNSTSVLKFEQTLDEADARNDPNALFLKGQNYMLGQFGFEKNTELAYVYLKEAADCHDHLESIYLLSQLLLSEVKVCEGFKYCRKAAEKGHSLAQIQLAELYAYGHGCERDEAEARRLVNERWRQEI